MRLLILCISIFAGISCSHICREDGLYENSIDRTSYFECVDGKAIFNRCPINEDGLSYTEFDGKKCVVKEKVKRQVTNQVSCPIGSVYDRNNGRCRITRYTNPTIVDSPEQSIPICPSGSTYDSRTGKCRSAEYFEPIIRREPPRVITTNVCRNGYQYVPNLDKCRLIRYVEPQTWRRKPVSESGGRYRRNGRFETILDNGQLVVDTWYELPWTWRNNGDQNQILL